MALRLVLFVSIVAAATAHAQSIAVNGAAPPTGITLNAGSAAMVSVSGGPGNPTDWIALYPTGAADTGYLAWSYLNGSSAPPSSGLTSATLSAYVPVTPGDFEWRLFANNSFTRIATSTAVTVTASPAVFTVNGVAAPTGTAVVAGAAVAVTLADGPGNATDWMALAAAGSSNTSYVDWRYLNGTTVAPGTGASSGSASFLAPTTPGAYEVRLFAHGTFDRVVTSGTITVSASAAALTVNGSAPPTAVPVAAGTYVSIGVSGGPGQPGDWVGLYAANAADNVILAWKYLNGSTTAPISGQSNATLSFAVPVQGGSYEFRFFNANTFTRLATSTSLVVSASAAGLSVNGVAAPTSTTAMPGSQAVVSVAGGPANPGDWVGVYLVGEPDSALLDWRYLNDTAQLPTTGVTTATLHFGTPTTPGTFEFRFFVEGGYGRLATSGPVVVPQTPAQMAVNGVAPPTPVTATPGSTISVVVTGGPANPTDWIALAAQGAANSSYLAWQYLNGSTVAPATGLANATVSFTLPSTAGTYEVRLFAANTYQRITTSSAITTSANPAVVTIALTAPFPGTILNGPTSLTLAAAASVTGGTITKVEFFAGPTLVGTATSSPYEATWSDPPQGVHMVTAAVTDHTNTLTTSAPAMITVNPTSWNAGTHAPPLGSLPSGTYATAQQVELVAALGTTIHYTTNNTRPTEASPVYAGPIAIAQNLKLRARAFQAGWTPSTEFQAAYVIGEALPTVVATVTPAANGFGWHGSDVIVSFTCSAPSGIASCSDPTSVRAYAQDYPETVTGTGVSTIGLVGSTTVSLRFDIEPPRVDIYEPAAGSDVPEVTTAVTVRGGLHDPLSGVDPTSVTCNGVPGTVTGGVGFVCLGVPVAPGTNTILVEARDRMGLMGTASHTVYVGNGPAPTKITVSPARTTLVVSDTRALRVRDDRGRIVTTGAWTSSEPTAATITVTDGIAIVEALSEGATTLTVTAGGLTAQAVVGVWASTAALPAVFESWTLEEDLTPGAAPLRGDILRATLNPEIPPEEQPGLFFVDEGTEYSGTQLVRVGTRPTRIRAVTLDGRELWDHRFAGRKVKHVAADQYGGVVIVREAGNDGNASGPWTGDTITKLDGRTGVVAWRREVRESLGYGRFGDAAIHPDGTVYVVEDLDYGPSILWGFDGGTGAGTAWTLPSGEVNGTTVAAAAAGPIIDADGAVQLVAAVWSGGTGWHDSRLMRVTLPEGGGLQVRDVATTPNAWWQQQEAIRDYRLLPDGQGGVLLGHRQVDYVMRIGLDLTTTTAWLEARPPGGDTWTRYETEYALGDDGAYAVVNGVGGSQSFPYYRRRVQFDPVTLQRLWQDDVPERDSVPTYSRLAFTTAGGGVQLTSATFELETQVAHGVWAYYGAAPTMWTAGSLGMSDSGWAQARGDAQSMNRYPQPFLSVEVAAFAGLREANAWTRATGWEWGGLICGQADRFYWSGIVTSRDSGQVDQTQSNCGDRPAAAGFHSHTFDGQTLPSGADPALDNSDISRADSFPLMSFFVKTREPGTNLFRDLMYFKPPSGNPSSSRCNIYERVSAEWIQLPMVPWCLSTP